MIESTLRQHLCGGGHIFARIAFVTLIPLVVGLHVAKAMYCEIGQEPDPESNNSYRWLIPVEDPCKCTEVRVGGLNMRSFCRPFKVKFYDIFLQSNDPAEIRRWLNCSETPPPCATGTKQDPAASCRQILQVCDRPTSGMYYLQNASMMHAVYCDMPGGWARFGNGTMQSSWNYEHEDREEIELSIISATDIEVIKEFSFSDFKIHTDVTFHLHADDSTNPSTVKVMYLPSLENRTLSIGRGSHHTNLKFNDEGDRLVCSSDRGGSAHDSCGTNGLPSEDQPSERLAITSLLFGPREQGARAKSNEWSRNRYTWSGSFYYLLAK